MPFLEGDQYYGGLEREGLAQEPCRGLGVARADRLSVDKGVKLPAAKDGQRVVGSGAEVWQGDFLPGLDVLDGHAISYLIGNEYGVTLLELLQGGISGGNYVQQSRQYEYQQFHL